MKHNQKVHYGGLFDNEEHAAMKINLLCDKMGIDRKNPMIDLKPDAMQQVMLIIHHIFVYNSSTNTLNINY